MSAVELRPMLRLLTSPRPDERPPDLYLDRGRRRAGATPPLPVGFRGRYLRRLLSPRRPVEQVLLSVIQQAYLAGAATRTVDALAETVGAPAADPEAVETHAREWDHRVDAFLRRTLKEPYRYLLLTQASALVREEGKVESFAVVVAVGITADGRREAVGLGLTPVDRLDRLWQPFFRELAQRGLRGVELVTSDRFDWMLPALASVFPGARWQRCREDFVADAIRTVPRSERPPVAASLRAVFNEPDAASALRALASLRRRFEFGHADLFARLDGPVGELLAHYQVPEGQRRMVSSLRALAPLRRELRRTAKLVGIFPGHRALRRLAGIMVQDASDEWAARRRHGQWPRVHAIAAPVPRHRKPTAVAGWAAVA